MREFSQTLNQLSRRVFVSLQSGLRFSRKRMEGTLGKLSSLSPLAVLERGYSIARVLPSRRIIRQTDELKIHDRVNVKIHQGEFEARVDEIFPERKNDP
jgi:exodeoxyribonuclease VII large subunit